jgi:predicted tellurium resistance membrane protein TerC
MVVYGHIIDPGHEAPYYNDHIQVAGPYCSIVAGMPLMFLAGWWVAGWWQRTPGVKAALVVWLAYTGIDLAILLASGVTFTVGVLFILSLATKFAAGYFGALLRVGRTAAPGAAPDDRPGI